ncbi:MAG: L-ribulose-5-phosphate 3-epimerase UlaE [Verrucomicrobiales bacterium]|nr:L-ribulose-5-phosphate 3-epimerase UlaE [Verrucomicrobiales bacterium]
MLLKKSLIVRLSFALVGSLCVAATFVACKTSAVEPAGVVKIPAKYKQGGFAIGCQAYSFNRFSVFEAIEKTAQTGSRVIEFYPGQKLSKEEPAIKWDHNASDETIAKVKAKLKEHAILAVNYGVVSIPKDEAGARKVFEFAKKMGLRGITTEDTGSIDTIEKMVKEYNIMVGFHDHPRQPNNPNYKMWDPNYILSVVKDRDPRIGSCADTGHWVRSGLKPVECLQILKGRIVSSHLKDLNEFGKTGAHDMPYGKGVSDVKAILDELKAQNFQGNISVEYEYNWDNSVPDIKECVDYVRNYPKM